MKIGGLLCRMTSPEKPAHPWPYWVLFGAVMVLILYPLSLGPIYWLMFRLPRYSWFPIDFDTLYSLWQGYSLPAFYLGGVPQNQLGIWLQYYIDWWHSWAIEPYLARSDPF